ncbi:GmrSD restriction endonuclease domain-containing protein [Demequina gelatinilytica]|uniref:GmrSD restriction endonuclease domain-containing protein n=1 Tax=Demequina gelatinilytica TaxID=1638980 RepID=UPI000783BA12|nr:DUF262 domain-containing protein [Demequina gelatinilytica]
MVEYSSARDKAHAVARMYYLGGSQSEPLGPGSKEKRSAIEALGTAVGLELRHVPGKVECCRAIAEEMRVEWDDRCWSSGDTVTLRGLNLLVDAVVARKAPHDPLARNYFLESVMEARAVAVDNSVSRRSDDANSDDEDFEFEFLDEDDESGDGPPAAVDDPDEALTVEQCEIAERVAALSAPASAAPRGVTAARTPLAIGARDFATGEWRTAVATVQGWLHLATDLDATSDDALCATLLEGMGDSRPSAAVAGTDLLEEAWTRLNERLERAIALREAFEIDVQSADDTSAAVSAASATWEQGWIDTEDEAENEGSGTIQALAETWPIADFVQHARDGELDLSPSYQRADVWPNSDAQILIESVLRGIPLPSVILLQRAGASKLEFEVVDGKQRLTSILRFTGNHPTALATVDQKAKEWEIPDLLHVFQQEYPRFKKIWKERTGKVLTSTMEREYYFPFPLRSGAVKALGGELEAFKGRYYSEVRNFPITVVGEPRVVRYIFEQTSQYRIPVIVYKHASPAQIHEVFSLYNKQGKHLNAEEIRNALYHHLPLMKGLLVAAGDSQDLDEVAPFLEPLRNRVAVIGSTLGRYGFARAGFRRTKLLAWAAAALLVDDGRPDSCSTASHINLLFKRVDGSRHDPLHGPDRVRALVGLLALSVEAHRALPPTLWHPAFRNSQGYAKWQELQLVAVLIGFAAAGAVHGEHLPEVVAANGARIRDLSTSEAWKRPPKTQSKVQWHYTSRVVADVLDALGVEPAAAARALTAQFGVSGLGALLEIAARR